MDKNIAAFLDDKAYTIQVCFPVSGDAYAAGKPYTYVTNIPGLVPGNLVIVTTATSQKKYVLPVQMMDIDEVLKEDAVSDGLKSHVITGDIQVVQVVSVDSGVDLAPNDSKAYGWVISKVDLAAYGQLMARNSKLTDAVTKAYRKSLKRSFADRILADMDSDDKDNLLKLLGK